MPDEANRAAWDARADEYQRKHGPFLRGAAWGTWQVSESELGLLGDVSGKDVLELGCGAARFSSALAEQGARCVGLDNSSCQLEHARELGVAFPLVHAAAEEIPLPDESFDVVFSDHGALSWGDPERVVPEVARVLRPGGLLVFNVTSPFARMCLDDEHDRQVETLLRPYFGLHEIDEGDGAATYNLGYGEWIRLLRTNGLIIEDLVELKPPDGATTTYGIPVEWAARWPAEALWVSRKP